MKYVIEITEGDMTEQDIRAFKKKLWGALSRLSNKAMNMGASETAWGISEGKPGKECDSSCYTK